MVEHIIDQFKEDFKLLIEAAFIAVKQLDEVNATHMFRAAQLLNPTSVAPEIGIGYIALHKMELKKASEIFEHVLEQDPEHYLAQTFLGLCYLLSKNKKKKGEKLIQEAIEKTDDPTVKNLGQVSLEWNRKEALKQDKAPFFK